MDKMEPEAGLPYPRDGDESDMENTVFLKPESAEVENPGAEDETLPVQQDGEPLSDQPADQLGVGARAKEPKLDSEMSIFPGIQSTGYWTGGDLDNMGTPAHPMIRDRRNPPPRPRFPLTSTIINRPSDKVQAAEEMRQELTMIEGQLKGKMSVLGDIADTQQKQLNAITTTQQIQTSSMSQIVEHLAESKNIQQGSEQQHERRLQEIAGIQDRRLQEMQHRMESFQKTIGESIDKLHST
ncbi:unnamed protein product [Owenia fusiformis]|uniref:Uncharacterized protein n=1 Tax=Owenia fusiformis TaxID=6347 RepID=A0A8S4NL12_OWEFU|nr:unnamed protein product [Owenia fusiformis]